MPQFLTPEQKENYFDDYDKDIWSLAKKIHGLLPDRWFTVYDLVQKSAKKYGTNQLALLQRAGFLVSEQHGNKQEFKIVLNDESRIAYLRAQQEKQLMEIEQLAGMTGAIQRKKYQAIIVRIPNLSTPLQWVDNAGIDHPCSLCAKAIEPGKEVFVVHESQEKHLRFHAECYDTVMAVSPLSVSGPEETITPEQPVLETTETEANEQPKQETGVADPPPAEQPVVPGEHGTPGVDYTYVCISDYFLQGMDDTGLPAIYKDEIAEYRDGQFNFGVWPLDEPFLIKNSFFFERRSMEEVQQLQQQPETAEPAADTTETAESIQPINENEVP